MPLQTIPKKDMQQTPKESQPPLTQQQLQQQYSYPGMISEMTSSSSYYNEPYIGGLPTTTSTAFTNVPATTTQKKTNPSEGGGIQRHIRAAAGMVWEDPSLSEWDPSNKKKKIEKYSLISLEIPSFFKDGWRLFVGDLGNETTDDILSKAFSKYPSFQRARVVRDKRNGKTRGQTKPSIC